jgi:hypothetical protein
MSIEKSGEKAADDYKAATPRRRLRWVQAAISVLETDYYKHFLTCSWYSVWKN